MYKIYFDFDGTLYNSNKLLNDYYNLFTKYGVNKEEIIIIKNQIFKNTLFDLDILTNYIIKEFKIPIEIKIEVENLYNNNYLYSDVIESIKKLNKKYKLYILTYGSYKYQMNKILSSNINRYIDNIIITENDKSQLGNVDYNNGIFIDNNPKEVEKFNKIGSYKVFRLRRKNDKYNNINTNYDILEYSDLITLINKELL